MNSEYTRKLKQKLQDKLGQEPGQPDDVAAVDLEEVHGGGNCGDGRPSEWELTQ